MQACCLQLPPNLILQLSNLHSLDSTHSTPDLNEWMWRRWLDDYDDVGTKPDSRAYLLKIVDMQVGVTNYL